MSVNCKPTYAIYDMDGACVDVVFFVLWTTSPTYVSALILWYQAQLELKLMGFLISFLLPDGGQTSVPRGH